MAGFAGNVFLPGGWWSRGAVGALGGNRWNSGAPDAVAPTFVFVAAPSLVPSFLPVEVQAFDNLSSLGLFRLDVHFPNLDIFEVVHNGTVFGPKYAGDSNVRVSVVSGLLTGLSTRFIRKGGWPDTSMTVYATAVDGAGNIGTATQTYTTLAASPSASVTATTSVTPAAGAPNRIRDLKVDPTTGDLVFADGDFVFVYDAEAIAQDVRLRFGFFLGEWYLDEAVGLPYFQEIFVKNPSLIAVREWFRRELLATPGILEIQTLRLEYTGARSAKLTLRCSTDLGELAVVQKVTV